MFVSNLTFLIFVVLEITFQCHCHDVVVREDNRAGSEPSGRTPAAQPRDARVAIMKKVKAGTIGIDEALREIAELDKTAG